MTTEITPFASATRRSGIAVWRQIADTLAGEIRSRCYADTGRLPSETGLAARFRVNRHTVRQAVGALQAEGLLRVEAGRGMFVEHEPLHYPLGKRTRFSENLQRAGVLPETQLLTARSEPASARVAEALELAAGAPVVLAEHLAVVHGQPLSLASAWYPADRFAGLLALLADGVGTSDALRQLGVPDYLRAHSRITAQMPGESTARLLKQPATRPLLRVESVDIDLVRRPIKYGETVFCGDAVQLCVSMEDAP